MGKLVDLMKKKKALKQRLEEQEKKLLEIPENFLEVVDEICTLTQRIEQTIIQISNVSHGHPSHGYADSEYEIKKFKENIRLK